jgi:CheY-like chemotaxis protein
VSSSLSQSVMLLDDEESYTELASMLLGEALKCPVHSFLRPTAALKQLPSLRPAVVVTDFSMPEMNGIDFIRQANSPLSRVPCSS